MGSRRRPERCSPVVAVALALAGAGCAAPTVPREVVAAAESRYLEPFKTARRVVALSVSVTCSPNFHDDVGAPAIDRQLHSATREKRDGSDVYRYANHSGGLESPLRLLIADTMFVAIRSVEIRVLSSSELRLDVDAAGEVVELAESGARTDCAAIEVRNGVWQRR